MSAADRAEVAASEFLAIKDKVAAYLATARAASADGLTWQEFGELLVGLLRLSIETLDKTLTLTGPAKKELVLEAAAALFDSVADKCVPLVAWPVWIILRPAVRSLVLAIASGAVESILNMVRGA